MIRKLAGLPFRAIKRAVDLLDGERSAPFPGSTPAASPPSQPAAAPAGSSPEPEPEPAPPVTESAAATDEASISVTADVTPNPNAMKFTLDRTVCETGSFSFSVGDDAVAHPIATALLALEGVTSVFGVNDFVTVSKQADTTWDDLMPRVVSAIKGAPWSG